MSKTEKIPQIPSSEITPEPLYISRRAFLKAAGLTAAALALAACQPLVSTLAQPTTPGSTQPTAPIPTPDGTPRDELGNPLNSFDDITNYNNYYEFSMDKSAVAPLSANFKSSPWQIQVGGLVSKPQTFTMEDLLKQFPQEERIYRLRCVEAWSMVIPWTGFPLAALLKAVEPTADAKYVHFLSADLPDQMPEVQGSPYPYPYSEGLRLDEAMNNLALLVTGLYGKPLPNQAGAPIRLVVPWKYGFKGAKSLVKIELVAKQPDTFWSTLASNEYGFYANVNPNVPHPRWSQSSERRIGENGRRMTLMFNGYTDQVAQLYSGMDLMANY